MVARQRDPHGPDEILAEIEGLLDEIESPGEPSAEDRLSHRMAERARPRQAARRMSVRLAAVLIVLSIIGTALALTQTTLPTQLLELWQSDSQATDFTVTQFTMVPVGDNQIDLNLTLQNDDVSTHFANVTVQLLDVSGDHLTNQTLPTGAVSASGTVLLSYVFVQAGLVASYEKSQIIVNQTA